MTRIAALLTFLWLPVVALAHESPYTYRAEIVSVYDGDTYTVNIDLGLDTWRMDESLRIYCINTPEVRGSEREEGLAVRDYVRELLPPGTMVTITTIKDNTGKFGRLLAIVKRDGDDRSINAMIYRNNMARIEAYSDSAREECETLLR